MIKQEQKVIEYFIQNNNESKHFEEVAEDLEILIPNVRRILGQGTLKGTFKRVAIGCYKFAHYETEETKTEKILKIVELGLNENKHDLQMVDIEDIQSILKDKYNIDINLYKIGGHLSVLMNDNKVAIQDVYGDIYFYTK